MSPQTESPGERSPGLALTPAELAEIRRLLLALASLAASVPPSYRAAHLAAPAERLARRIAREDTTSEQSEAA